MVKFRDTDPRPEPPSILHAASTGFVPRAIVPPRDLGIGEPIYSPPRDGVIPNRDETHGVTRMKSFDLDGPDSLSAYAIRDVIEKLRLEDERVRRLLPTPPDGSYWHAEIQSSTPDLASFEASVKVRIVYRLRDVE